LRIGQTPKRRNGFPEGAIPCRRLSLLVLRIPALEPTTDHSTRVAVVESPPGPSLGFGRTRIGPDGNVGSGGASRSRSERIVVARCRARGKTPNCIAWPQGHSIPCTWGATTRLGASPLHRHPDGRPGRGSGNRTAFTRARGNSCGVVFGRHQVDRLGSDSAGVQGPRPPVPVRKDGCGALSPMASVSASRRGRPNGTGSRQGSQSGRARNDKRVPDPERGTDFREDQGSGGRNPKGATGTKQGRKGSGRSVRREMVRNRTRRQVGGWYLRRD